MLIPINKLQELYRKEIKGIIHIGAHYGQEFASYKEIGVKNLIFFEPVRETFDKLIRSVPTYVDVFNIALGNETGEVDMFIETANQGMSSSILEPKQHLDLYPHITFDKKEKVRIDKLDNIIFDRQLFNMINIDVQGYELEVFKGAAESLRHIDVIYSEINIDEVYKGCALIGEVDEFLGRYGFIRAAMVLPCPSWGDAIYIKDDNIS